MNKDRKFEPSNCEPTDLFGQTKSSGQEAPVVNPDTLKEWLAAQGITLPISIDDNPAPRLESYKNLNNLKAGFGLDNNRNLIIKRYDLKRELITDPLKYTEKPSRGVDSERRNR